MADVTSIAAELEAEPAEPIVPEQREPTMVALIALCERLDEGLQLASVVIAQLDQRVRKLEIAENKRLHKLVIVKPGEA
jgi:hypothetical protein